MRFKKYLNESIVVSGALTPAGTIASTNGMSQQTRAVGDKSEIDVLNTKPNARFNKLLGIYMIEGLIGEAKSEFETLQKNKVPLEPEERAEVMKRKCVWHHGPDGAPSPAIWKSKTASGETRYICNTHRAYQSKPTLKGAIKAYDFIKTTA